MIRATLLLAMIVALHPATGGAQEASAGGGAYEGWRQYSVHCARCHGQDVLGNPVAANLLVTTAPGGTSAKPDAFTRVVHEGRTGRGMPAFKGVLTPEQTQAIYQYVRGRAEKKIPPGRPKDPAG